MERVQFQKEKEALERRIVAGMKKADGIQEQLNVNVIVRIPLTCAP
jgi:hypothetical protein